MFGRNWKKAEDYEDLHGMEPRRLAWEFLRRKQQYRDDYNFLHLTIEDPQFDKWRWLTGRHNLREAFGFPLPDPETEQPQFLENMFITPGRVRMKIRCKESPLTLKDNEVAFIFDFSLPINRQIKAAEKQLKRLQKRANDTGKMPYSCHNLESFDINIKLKPIKKYIEYLRLLDADAAGATQKEMLEFIYPEEMIRKAGQLVHPDTFEINQFIKEKIKKARSYRDQKYNEIASLSQ